MPVMLSVSQVRQALFQALGCAENVGDGAASTSVLGQWFHETMQRLIFEDKGAQLDEIAADLDLWKQTLVEAAYSQSIGPRLVREYAGLHTVAPQVLSLWHAVREACDWLAELYWQRSQAQPTRRAGQNHRVSRGPEWLAAEVPLACELRAPGWTDSVRLTGIADAVLRVPPRGDWCVIEFKIGQTSPIADLGQACLYHLMILSREPSAETDAPPSGSLAVVSFRPQRHERVFTAEELRKPHARLMDVIGKLAGVDPKQSRQGGKGSQPVENLAPNQLASAAAMQALHPSAEHLELGRGLVATWAEYGVSVSLDQPVIAGPTFIRFPITLGRGITVSAVSKYASELQVRMALREEPFINREDVQLVVDVQRPDRQTVLFADVRGDLPAPDPITGGSHVPIGVDLYRRLVCADLSKTEHAHLLVAGTTGSGKSEWLRLALAGLLITNTPQTLRLLVIDPKRNAFHALRNSPYLWRPLVFPDEQSTEAVLRELAEEMDRRYRIADGADSFRQLATQSPDPLPRIVCVCDEYRDLISRDRKERKLIEAQIARLGAKARAAGIHLILATQEASRDTIRGSLDANMPARVGLKMGKAVESRMLLSEPGAEKLLGYGDLLFKDLGRPRRLQAPLLSDQDRSTIFGADMNP